MTDNNQETTNNKQPITNNKQQIRIILVEPAGALNVGSVARVMKNMGLTQLVLVNPQCDRFSDEARKMAVHAADILEEARIVESLPDAIAGCQRIIATTGRDRSLPTALELPRTALPWLLETPSALIFGREDRGLSNEELNYAQRFVKIPASSDYQSLNLAPSVAVCAYELYLAATTPENSSIYTAPPAPVEAVERYYKQLETLLLKIGYLYPHTSVSRMEKFRRLYNRAELSQLKSPCFRGFFLKWIGHYPSTVL
jgi:tRNA/rRNA methyltransferase